MSNITQSFVPYTIGVVLAALPGCVGHVYSNAADAQDGGESGDRGGESAQGGSSGKATGGRTGGKTGSGGTGGTGASSNSGGSTTSSGGGATTSTGGVSNEKPGLTLTPLGSTMIFGATQTFVCKVVGVSDTTCTFTADSGNGAASGGDKWVYTAPSTAGTYKVTATSKGDPTLTQTANIKVVSPNSPGEWINVTPSDITLDRNFHGNDQNYGVQDVVVDPARPSDFYAFVCYQGVWRSQDYGQTWKKVSKAGSDLETGRPWSAGIDSNAARNKDSAPALYTLNGYGSKQGVFKSTDWGVNWTRYELPAATGNDAYSIEVDPYDGNHILMGFHEAPGLIESTDAGQTWKALPLPSGSGDSIYAYFINTGDPATTRKTFIIIAQANGRSEGTRRTEDGGQNWTKVDGLEHGHGTSQSYQPGVNGTIYLPGIYGNAGNGVYRSTDFGKTWKSVTIYAMTTVTGTPNYLYGNTAQGWDPGNAQAMRATAASGDDWVATPEVKGMTDGSKKMAVSYDGTHYVIVGGNWHAGIWRYVEP
jgi:hypothetical protein